MATRLRNVLATMIQEDSNIYKFAEIGVLKSQSAKQILKVNHKKLLEYWMVDPWMAVSSSNTEQDISKEEWDHLHFYACSLMLQYPQLHVVRAKSIEVASIFPDEYFDFVFIDADHSYETVKADIEVWMPKVKRGGILGGHDYHNIKGVAKAVNECFGKRPSMPSKIWLERIL